MATVNNEKRSINGDSTHLSLDSVTLNTESSALPDTVAVHDDVDLEEANERKKEEPTSSPPPPSGKIDPSSFPDGGFQAWLVIVGTFCCLFVSFGWVNCECIRAACCVDLAEPCSDSWWSLIRI